MTPYLVCPEFLPALTRILARSGLCLSVLAKENLDAKVEAASALKLALERGLKSDDLSERYAAEALLERETTTGHGEAWCSRAREREGEPQVGAGLRSLRLDALCRLAIPGAVILGMDAKLLRQGPLGIAVIPASDIVGESQDCQQRERQELVDVVICEVAYGKNTGASTPVVSAQHDVEVHSGETAMGRSDGGSPTRATSIVRACRVEVLQTPWMPFGDVQESMVNAAGAWAEAICRRCAAPVFVAPAFHSQLAQLLIEIGASPASLSARSASSRGCLAAKLVTMSRKLRELPDEAPLAGAGASGQSANELVAKANICLAAASASSTVTSDAIHGTALGEDTGSAPLLLLKGRDFVPEGALVAGATVEREMGHGVTLILGASHPGTLMLKRHRMPRGRISTALPSQGTPLACLLLRPGVESGLADSISPALMGSSCAAMEDMLARQVGLRVLDVAVPDGRPDRAKACRHLAEACGPSLRVEPSPDGLRARITGAPPEVEAAAQKVRSLAGQSVPVPERLAWRVVGRGGTGIRQLEQDSGGAWIRVESERNPPTIEIFGGRSAVHRAEALIQERHAYDSLEIPGDAVARIIGRGGSAIREMEASSGGASIFVDSEKCVAEVMGNAPAVQRAMAELRERSAPARRVEVPRHVIPYVIGRNGSSKREMETASGAFLKVETEAEACFVEISGLRSSIEKASLLIEKLLQQHAYGSFKVPHDVVPHISGHGGALLRQVEASTGASVQIGSCRDHCLVEVLGEQAAVDTALEALKRRLVMSRRQISIPRHSLSCVIGRAGTGAQDIEVATGASLQVDLGDGQGSEMCTIEARGDEKQIDDAEAALRARSEASEIKVPCNRVSWIIGRGGSTIRELQAATSAVIYVPDDHGETCDIQVYGSLEARTVACKKITAILSTGRPDDKCQRSRSPSLASTAVSTMPMFTAAGWTEDMGGSLRASRQLVAASVPERPLFAPKAKMLAPPHRGTGTKRFFPPAPPAAPSLWTCTASLRYGHAPRKGLVDAAAEASIEASMTIDEEDLAAATSGIPSAVVLHQPTEGEDRLSGNPATQSDMPKTLHQESLLQGKTFRENVKVRKNAAAAGLPWSWQLPIDLNSPPPKPAARVEAAKETSAVHGKAAEKTSADHEKISESLLSGKALPKQLLLRSDRTVPWVWKWPLNVGTPQKQDPQAVGEQQSVRIHDRVLMAEEPAVHRSPNLSSSWENSRLNSDPAADASSNSDAVLSSVVAATPCLPAAAETPSSPLPNLQWVRNAPAPPKDLSVGKVDSPSFSAEQHLESADTLGSGQESMAERGVQPFPWSWSLPIKLNHSTPKTSEVARGPLPATPQAPQHRKAEDDAVQKPVELEQRCEIEQAVASTDAAAKTLTERLPLTPTASGAGSISQAPSSPPRWKGDIGAEELACEEQEQLSGTKQSPLLPAGVQLPRSWTLPSVPQASASPEGSPAEATLQHESRSTIRGRSPVRIAGRSRSKRRSAGQHNSSSQAASGEASRQPRAAPRRSGRGVPPGPPPPSRWSLPGERAKAAARAAARLAKAATVATTSVVPRSVQHSALKAHGSPTSPALPLFPAASPDSTFWAALPTPVRATAELSTAFPPAKRSKLGRSPEVGTPSTSKAKLFVLDGMNILKSSNNISWGVDEKEQCLEWGQLERACRYYTSRGHQVSVYLPPLRAGHEEQLGRCCREFGNIFVSCRSASDDQFMINTVKLYQDEHGIRDLEGQPPAEQDAEPCCFIVTNDRFEDWKQRGDVNSAWVERHCVRFAFGPGGFVPSKLM